MSLGENPEEDAEMMEELLTDIAEVADGLQRAYAFASSLELNQDPAHWLFDYTLGLARTLVGLGDEKSQRYGAEWIKRVVNHVEKFEGDGINMVVRTIQDAWKRGEVEQRKNRVDDTGRKQSKLNCEHQRDHKRRKK